MTPRSTARRTCVAATAALALLGGGLAAATPATAVPPRAQETLLPPDGGRLHPVTPSRVLDTRESGGPVRAGTPRELVVLGQGGVPETGVSAVVLNVTVTLGSERSDLQVFPVGQRPPQRTSNVNWRPGETVPVQVQTGVGDGGRVALSVHGGSAHVVVDVFGWYGDGSRSGSGTTAPGSGYTALSPTRLLDTRETGGAVEAGRPRTVQVSGRAGVPADATAVMMNTTFLGTPGNADLQVFPAGQRPQQRTSNLNTTAGEVRANAVLTPLGDGGRIGLSVSEDTGHVVLDVVGYYSPSSGGRFVSLSPTRVLDTRRAREPVRAGDPRTPTLADRGGVPLNADAVVLNVTGTAATAPLDLQVYPVGDRPERRTSTLNLEPGEAVPNLAVTTLGRDGRVGLSAAQGSVHVVLDVLGYVTSATRSSCSNPQGGWDAEYPADWRTNAGTVLPRCSLFDPAPIALDPQPSEIPLDLAVQLRREPVSLSRARQADSARLLEETQRTVDGRTAYRQEREQSRSTTVPTGTRSTVWLVDLGDETLIASTYDVGDPDYSTRVQALDDVMGRLDLHDQTGGSGSTPPPFPDGTGASSSEASADARLTVADIRTGAHDGFDRTVLDLGGQGVPGWTVQYRDTVREQGSGREIALEGDASLQVLVRGTVAPPSTEEPYYGGPDRIDPQGTTVLQEVHAGTWFEGVYDVALGLSGPRPFRVFALTGPDRLVVDVAHEQPAPADVAAVTADGRVVVLDGQSGEVRRVLLEDVEVDDPSSNAITVSPDRQTVFVVRPGSTGSDSRIVRVSAAGGAAEEVAQGSAPAVSPDGSTLAYVRFVDTDQPGQADPTIRLRDLATGQERALTGGDHYGIWDLAWTADGSRIAFTAGEIGTGVHVVARSAGSLAEAQRLGPADTDASWTDVATLSGDRLAVVERCCGDPVPDPQRWRVLEVDATTGAVGDEVFGRDRTEAALVDDRRDGRGLLVVQGGGPGGSPLLRWDGSGELRRLAEGVVVAAW